MEKDYTKYYAKIMFKAIILLFIALIIFVAYKITMFYIPFLIAILIAAMIEPIIQFFMKKCKLKRKLASTLSLILVVVIIGSLLVLLSAALVTEANTLISSLNEPIQNLYKWTSNFINDLRNGMIHIPDEVLNTLQDSLGSIINGVKDLVYNILSHLINTVSSIPTMITYSVITLLAIIFICYDKDYVKNLVNKHIPKAWIEKGKEVINTTCSIGWNYLKAEAKLSLLCFILVLIGLNIFDLCGLNVEYSVLMAIFIGFVDLLPLFGAGAVMVPWAVYLFFTGNMPLAIAVMILWIIWAVIKQFLEPKFVSRQMGMNPIFTLIGMYTGFRFFGVLGLMIGPILLLILTNIFKRLFEKGIVKSFFELE